MNDLKAVHALRGLLRNIRPDIVHLHSSKAGMVGRLAAAGLSMKVIFTVHGWGFTPGVGTKRQILMKYIEKKYYSRWQHIISVFPNLIMIWV
nr:glycosyltransferase [Secundilactobacillus oryzae]